MNTAVELKSSLTRAVQKTMRRNNLNVTGVANLVGCNRKVVQRVLDPNYTGISLKTIEKFTAALALEPTLKIRALPLTALSPIADQLAKASSADEVSTLTKKFLEGYYGKRIRIPNAKAKAV